MADILPGYVRVSEVLAQWKLLDHIPPNILQKAAERGTHIHQEIYLWSQGLATSQEPMFYSYQCWMAATDAVPFVTEYRVYDDNLKVTGCIDALMDLGDGHFTLVDYKTSANEDPKMWPLQGAFYHYLIKNNLRFNSPYKLSDEVLFLKLDREGKAPKEYRYKVTDALLNVCLSALNCYRYLNG